MIANLNASEILIFLKLNFSSYRCYIVQFFMIFLRDQKIIFKLLLSQYHIKFFINFDLDLVKVISSCQTLNQLKPKNFSSLVLHKYLGIYKYFFIT